MSEPREIIWSRPDDPNDWSPKGHVVRSSSDIEEALAAAQARFEAARPRQGFACEMQGEWDDVVIEPTDEADRPLADAFQVMVESGRRWWDTYFWTITCPLPDGGEVFQVYDRQTGEKVGGGSSSPYHDIGLDEYLEGRR